MTIKFFYLQFIIIFFLFSSCAKNEDGSSSGEDEPKEFAWHDDLMPGDIPDFPVKGFIDGKEIQISYVNFERWRGSNDNVINFSAVKPSQPCGFIEEFSGFVLLNKGNAIGTEGFKKPKFSDNSNTYRAFYKTQDQKSAAEWNCDLVISNIDEKTVTGRILIFFKDEKKSWLAGKFEASICNN